MPSGRSTGGRELESRGSIKIDIERERERDCYRLLEGRMRVAGEEGKWGNW